MKTIIEKAKDHLQKQQPFVLYKQPDANTVSGLFQLDAKTYTCVDYSEKGFVFAPFNTQEDVFFIPFDKADLFVAPWTPKEIIECPNIISKSLEKEKETHVQLVQKGINQIGLGDFKKVVLARKESVALTNFNLEDVFSQMTSRYTNAFVYAWFHPKTGLWMGASPETLVKINEAYFETMSLAGTQQISESLDHIDWGAKEKEEQLLVTQFIQEQLYPVSSSLSIGEVQTAKAGNLLHLRTKIHGEVLKGLPVVKTLIEKLHPTPAVCGLPRDKAKQFILSQEANNRKYYSGFLGLLNTSDLQSELYVNLRCMELSGDIANLYIGGGITQESDPEKEWEETVAKSLVMKKVLS
ncbi:hypothetical protein GCM10011416_22560 [Polaribacter pacificus]|uniref:isochorismate synthase n=1 Tax=Polaribacter pacificus TaxID=1775173 RepID=A0A917MH85_9FLAO|nr:chorismate-binding protein [Polaribacter pacificus]GGH03144.1 hypothetical protein GCM10011416_22560 [Polaribacter pacificus]